VHTGLFWGNVEGRNHLEDLGVDGYVILKQVLNMIGRYGLVNWLMSGISGSLLYVGN
jgi:hypothetical protein